MSPQKRSDSRLDVFRYLGLGMQIFVALGLAVFAGLKADGWLGTGMPLLVWLLPLLVIVAMIIKLIKETTNSKTRDDPEKT